MNTWSSLLGAPGRPRLLRMGAAAVVLLIAIDAGGAVGLHSGSGSSNRIGIGSTTSSTSPALHPGRSSTARVATSTTTGAASPTTVRPSSPARPSVTTTTAATSTSVKTVPTSPTTAAGPSGQRLPPPGTYTYDTSGSYSLKSVFFNQNGSYGPTSQIAVAAYGCGQTDTWTQSSNSSQQTYLCPVPGGLRVYYLQTTQYGMTQRFDCDAHAFIPVTGGTAGQQWHFSCTSPSPQTTADQTVTLKGHQVLDIGGQAVNTVQVEVDSTFSGNVTGSAQVVYWFSSDALAVKETGTTDAQSRSPSGHLTSNYVLTLKSLQPS